MVHIVFAGGGTAGHIFPGIAIINELTSDARFSFSWIGSSKGMDRSIVEGSGVRFYGIPVGKLRRYFSLQNILDLFKIAMGCLASIWILIRLKPALVFSKGGFASVPPCFAAKVLGIKVITHECDFSPGLATKINTRFASRIFTSFPETASFFPERMRDRILCTGNPVRSAFYKASAQAGRRFLSLSDSAVPVLLILGGSLGARQINEIILGALDRLVKHCVVVHQTGLSAQASATFAVSGESVNADYSGLYKPYAFIRDEMADVLASASLVIARSGANTVWECAATGKPMILIPLEKGSSRGDQVENAEWFTDRGAALTLRGEDACAQRVTETVVSLLRDKQRLASMAEASARLGAARPAAVIAQQIKQELELTNAEYAG